MILIIMPHKVSKYSLFGGILYVHSWSNEYCICISVFYLAWSANNADISFSYFDKFYSNISFYLAFSFLVYSFGVLGIAENDLIGSFIKIMLQCFIVLEVHLLICY